MRTFLLIDLSAGTPAFLQPLVAQVQQQHPNVATLDLDARSNELLLHYALRLLREAERTVVLVKASESGPDFGNVLPLVEELLTGQPDRLILLLGDHPRLLRMLQARAQLTYKVVADEAEAMAAVSSYFAAPEGAQG